MKTMAETGDKLDQGVREAIRDLRAALVKSAPTNPRSKEQLAAVNTLSRVVDTRARAFARSQGGAVGGEMSTSEVVKAISPTPMELLLKTSKPKRYGV